MPRDTYIINLAFDTWQNQVWFCDTVQDECSDRRWSDAKQTLEDVGERCSNASDFFNEAVKHFEEYGFVRIQK